MLQWRWTLVIEGCMMLLGVVCGLSYRPIPREDETAQRKPDEQTSLVSSSPKVIDGCCCSASSFCYCMCSSIKDTFDLKMLTSPVYITICFSIFMFNLGYHVPFTFTPVRAEVVYHIPAHQSAFLISIMGITNVFSRPIFGWIGDKEKKIRYVNSNMHKTHRPIKM